MYRQQQELEEEALYIYTELNKLRDKDVPEHILNSIAHEAGLPDAKLPTILNQKIRNTH